MRINLENILAFDLETIPKEGFNENHPLYDTWANRNRKENLSMEELIEKFNNEGGLYGEYLTVVCISAAFIHNGEIRINSFTGDEKDIIDNFLKVAEFVHNRALENKGKLIALGHNIANYDIPVCRKVYSRYYPMFNYPDYISDLNTSGVLPIPEKPWILSERMLDTLQLQKGTNYMFSSMAEVAISLGLPSPKQDTDGSKVAQMFREGRIQDIKNYCEGDVLTSFGILFKWIGQEVLPIAQKSEPIEVKELSVLERLYQTNSFSAEIKKELEKTLKKKKITDKDKEGIKEIVLAVYIRDDFENNQQDGKKVIESKTQEVEEWLKTL